MQCGKTIADVLRDALSTHAQTKGRNRWLRASSQLCKLHLRQTALQKLQNNRLRIHPRKLSQLCLPINTLVIDISITFVI